MFNKDKEDYERTGYLNYKTSKLGIRCRPSYIEMPDRKHDRTQPEAIRLKKFGGYPKAIGFILRNASYFYSYAGFPIARDYAYSYGLSAYDASILIILSFHDAFFLRDFKYWALNTIVARRSVMELVRVGFVHAIKVASPTAKSSARQAYVLSTLGINFVEGYEAFFDHKMEEIKSQIGVNGYTKGRTRVFLRQKREEEALKKQIWEERIFKKRPKKN